MGGRGQRGPTTYPCDARHLSPFLGERMRASRLLDTPMFIHELLPQDLKLAPETTTTNESLRVDLLRGLGSRHRTCTPDGPLVENGVATRALTAPQ